MRLSTILVFLVATLSLGMTSKNLPSKHPQSPLPGPQSSILKQILRNNPKINSAYAEKLAGIITVKSKKYGISAKVFTAILMQESAYRLDAKHVVCGYREPASLDAQKTCVVTDFGIAQIHHLNLDRYGFNRLLLMTDLDYSVESGAKILASYKSFQKMEPKTWYSRYNCGNRSFGQIQDRCVAYKHLVDRYM